MCDIQMYNMHSIYSMYSMKIVNTANLLCKVPMVHVACIIHICILYILYDAQIAISSTVWYVHYSV